MYKIAHISDLHISFEDEKGYGKRLVKLLGEIKEKECDHVVVTGDIVENPTFEDLQYTRQIFTHFGLLDSSKMSLVPGNHDIFGGLPKGQESFRFYFNCKEVNFAENVENFIDTFRETFPNNNSFPYLKVINNIAIIGINSMGKWSFKNNREGSNGFVERKNLEKLKDMLSSEDIKEKYKIILIHHHFNKPGDDEQYPAHSLWLKAINWKMKLYSRKNIIKLLKKYKVNLILNGHIHINQVYNTNRITIVNSSSCVMPLTDDQVRKYNIVSIPEKSDVEKSIKIETFVIE